MSEQTTTEESQEVESQQTADTVPTLQKKFIPWIVGSLLIVIGLAAIYYFAFGGSLASAKPQIDSKVMPVETRRAEKIESYLRQRHFTGVIKAARASNLSFERTGNLTEIKVTEGEFVCENQVLAVLDQRNLNAQKKRLEAQKAAADARLAELEKGPRKETIDAAKANVKAFETQFAQAEREYETRKRLRDSGAISKEEFQQIESRKETAAANLDAAQKKLDELEAGTREEQKAAQRAVVAEIEANLEDVDVEIEKSSLLAPFNGQVASRYLDEGAVVSPGVPVIRVVEIKKLEAWIGIPAGLIERYRGPESKKMETLRVDGKEFDAKLKYVLPEIDPTTRTQQVVLELLNSDQLKLPPGQIVRITVPVEERVQGFWVPTACLVPAARGNWNVLVAEKETDNQWKVTKREVQIVVAQQAESLVSGTLAEGDNIICAGVHKIGPGSPVKPVIGDRLPK